MHLRYFSNYWQVQSMQYFAQITYVLQYVHYILNHPYLVHSRQLESVPFVNTFNGRCSDSHDHDYLHDAICMDVCMYVSTIYNSLTLLLWFSHIFVIQSKRNKLIFLLLIACSCLFITQASSSFKRLNTRTFTYTTPTFITEVLHLVMLVQLFLMTVWFNTLYSAS